MKMTEYLTLRANGWFETYSGLMPVPSDHPPSLRNPIPVKIPLAQDGWKQGSSKLARDKAIEDLGIILDRTKRQEGNPTMSRSATYATNPSFRDWE